MRTEEDVIFWHHGTCDMCQDEKILVCHFGYDTQGKRDYRICENCMAKNIKEIIYGKDCYESGLVDSIGWVIAPDRTVDGKEKI